MTADSSPGLTLMTMQDLEANLEGMLNEWAEAESDMVHAKGRVELEKAKLRLELKTNPPAGPKLLKDDLDAKVLVLMWEEHGDLMAALLSADARCAGFTARFKTADRTLSSKQSRLNADTKIHGGNR